MEEILKRQNIHISNITNPFDPMHNREFKEVPRGLSLKECIDLVRDPLSGCFYVAAVNGELVPEDADYALIYPQGNVVLCATPEGGGGGGGGKNTLRIVLQLVVVIVAAAATWYMGGAGGAYAAVSMGLTNSMVVGGVANMALGVVCGLMVSIAGNMLIGALLPYDMGTDVAGSEASSQESSTYSWQGATNSNREGVVWPVLYGTMRITPPIIGKYIEVVGDLQYLNILYAVADHAIDSIDETSIKINDNLVTKNVDGITWEYRLGALNQTPIQYFNDARTMKSSGAKLSTSWTTIDADGTETEGLGIAVSFPRGLYSAQNDGTIGGFSVALNIEYKEASASTWTRFNTYRQTPLTVTTGRWSAGYYDSAGGWCEVLAGTTTVSDHIEGEAYYQADYSLDQWINLNYLTASTPAEQQRNVYQWRWVTTTTIVAEVGSIENTYVTVSGAQTSAIRRVFYADRIPAGSYQVRVALVSAESTDTKVGDDTYLEYVESIIYDDFSYPGSTVFALRALATDKLSGGMPVMSMIATRSTVPVWTGAAYENLPADNPAWASYDALHDSNYGGDVDHSRIVYSDFLKWANNCDLHYTSVGVASPVSFKCNYYVDAGTSVRKILNDLGVLGRGNTVQMGSYFTCFVDKLESLPAQSFLFNMGNIEAKSFSIEYMEMESRANAVDVTFWDKDNNYDQKTLEIHASDFDATTTEIKKTQITLRGCTTRAEALAHGNFAMNNNRLLTTTANWSADIDAIGCLPWDVVEAQHDHTLWGDGGLVVSGTTDTVVLDKELTLAADTTYTLNIQSIATDEIKQYTLATLQEETTTAAMVITTTFDPIPAEHDKWTVSTVGVSTKLFRLMRTTRMDDLTRKLVCLEYNPDIYDDSGALDAPEVPVLPTYEAHLQAREIQKWNGSPDTEIQLSWTGFALRWHVFWKKASGVLGESNWRYAGATMEPMLRIPSLDQQADVYTFCVSHTQNPADGITVDLAVTGTAIIAIPGTPVNLTAAIRGQVIVLQWNAATDVSVTGYTIYLNGSAITTNFGGTVYVYAETLTAGVYNFTLAAVNRGGTSTPTDAASLTIAVPTTPAPAAVIVGEQVVVTWADCQSTLPIAYYTINAVKQGKATRYLDRINWVGARDYDVIAVDVAGNQSAEGTTSITVTGLTAITGIIATGHTYNIRLDLTYETFDEFETVEIWSNTINNRTGAVKVGETAATAWTHSGLSLIDTRYYWTRTRNTFGTVGTWYPVSATAGIACSTSTEPSDYLNALAGKLSESELTATLSNRIDWIDTEEFVLDEDIIEPNIMNGLNGAFCGLSDVQAVHKASIDSLLSSTVATALDVMGLQAEVASLTTTEWSATGDYILGKYVVYDGEVYRCLIAYTYAIDGTKTPGVDTTYWEPADALATIVSDIDMRVDDLEGEIVNKVSTTTFNALDNRVIAAESTVSQHSDAILLRVTQSDFDALGNLFIPDFNANSEYVVNDYVKHLGASYVCIEEIDFTPAPTPAVTAGWETYWEVAVFSDRFSTVINQVDVNTNGISLASEAITGDLALLVDIVEHGTVVEDAGDIEDVDIRITQAGMDIDGINAEILLYASQITGLDNRLSQAEIDIDGANAAILLRATQSSLDATNSDLGLAEIAIDANTASIGLHATRITTLESTTGGHTTQINQALIDIDAAEAAILLRASKTEIDGLIAPVYSATTLYNTGNQVRYNYSGTLWRLYQCKNNNTVGHAPTETSYWTVVSSLASRVSTAETSITAGEAGTWSSISNKVSTSTYNSDQKVGGALRIATAETAIGVLDTDVGNIKAQYTVKLNVNNRVAGFGLMLSEDTPSEFVVVAEKFQVVDNSDALNPKQVFTIGNIGGNSAVGINGDMIIDGSILARNIGANEIIANSANIKDAVITNAKIANATIEGAKIKDATITSAKIGTIEASKITAGTIGAQTIYLGDSHVVLDGVNKCIRVYDENNVLRVELGLLS